MRGAQEPSNKLNNQAEKKPYSPGTGAANFTEDSSHLLDVLKVSRAPGVDCFWRC